jgi:hypothetical protein
MGSSSGYYSSLNGLDPVNLNNDYNMLSFNRAHVINATYSYQEGIKFHGNRLVGAALNNWEASGITSWQSGPNLAYFGGVNYGLNGGVSYGNSTTSNGQTTTTTVSIPINAGYYLGSSDYGLGPTVKCDPRVNLKSHQYANGNCFGLPTPGSQGSWRLPYVTGPAFFKSDLSVYKNVKINERQNMQIRFSGFNFLNHPLTAFSEGTGTPNVSLTVGNGSAMPTSANQAIQQAVITNGSTFGIAPYKSGVRILEGGVKYNF